MNDKYTDDHSNKYDGNCLFIHNWLTCQIKSTLMIHQNDATVAAIDILQAFYLVSDS